MVPLLIAVIYFLGLSIVVGFILGRRVKILTDFTKAGQSLGWLLVTCGFVLLPLGAGHTISLWEASAGLGASVLWWPIIVGGVFVPLMMLWLGPWLRELGVDTFPEVMDRLYGTSMRYLHASVNVASWTGITAAETLATAAAIYGLSNGAIPYQPWCVLLGFVLVVCYVLFAGALQLAWLNVINAIALLAGSYLALAYLGGWLGQTAGGWEAISNYYAGAGEIWKLEVLKMRPELFYQVVIPVAVLHISACGVFQGMYTPLLSARSDSDCRKGVFLAAAVNGISSFPWIVMALVGMAIPAIAAVGPKLVVPALATQALPPWVVGLLMVSLLGACLSSAGGFVLGNANVIISDIFKRALWPEMADETRLKLMRPMVIICAALALIPALTVPIIFPVFLWCFSFGIPVFVMYVYGMLWKVSRQATWITIIVAYVVNFVWTFATPSWAAGPWALNMYPVTVISLVLGTILTAVLPGETGLLARHRTGRTAVSAAGH